VDTITTDKITVAGDFKIDAESDLGRLVGIVVDDGTDHSWPLTQLSKSRFDTVYPDINTTSDTGEPKHFCLFADTIYFGWVPDKTTYVYRISYSQVAGTISSGTASVPFTSLYRDLLLMKVLQNLYIGLEDFQKAQFYENEFEKKYVEARRREEQVSGEHIFAMQSDDSYNNHA